ncbi:unnamed protein product [Polarella glacialis]|uniref:Uncharacterized protein n=1 Tax=Polarella glacialis TaxID=89957 RepID=A0A813HSU1_POLGL|nr:unnamed protein product [Polarella glacialis]
MVCGFRRQQLLLFLVWAYALSAVSSESLPPAVVVHGRRGRNSNINGMYIRDFTWQGQIGTCYKRGGSAGEQPIFLYFEGEWRLGPSPEQGSVWAFSRSSASSPLLIDAPWEVWDGQKVAEDRQIKVSDTSVVPPVPRLV